jgi:hypothetical protein
VSLLNVTRDALTLAKSLVALGVEKGPEELLRSDVTAARFCGLIGNPRFAIELAGLKESIWRLSESEKILKATTTEAQLEAALERYNAMYAVVRPPHRPEAESPVEMTVVALPEPAAPERNASLADMVYFDHFPSRKTSTAKRSTGQSTANLAHLKRFSAPSEQRQPVDVQPTLQVAETAPPTLQIPDVEMRPPESTNAKATTPNSDDSLAKWQLSDLQLFTQSPNGRLALCLTYPKVGQVSLIFAMEAAAVKVWGVDECDFSGSSFWRRIDWSVSQGVKTRLTNVLINLHNPSSTIRVEMHPNSQALAPYVCDALMMVNPELVALSAACVSSVLIQFDKALAR